jgi:hypothetical protein
MSLALDDLPRGPDRPLYDLPPMTEVITWQKASLVSAQGKHDTFRKYLDATHAAIGKLRLMIRWLPPRQFGRRLERLTSYQFHLGLENLKQAAAVAGMAQEAASGSCGTPHPIHAARRRNLSALPARLLRILVLAGAHHCAVAASLVVAKLNGSNPWTSRAWSRAASRRTRFGDCRRGPDKSSGVVDAVNT